MFKIGIATVLLTAYISTVVGHGGGWQDPNQVGPEYGEAVDRAKLQDIKVLTLRDGKMTTGRRSRPLQQLNCVGGSAKGLFFPSVVQCYNRGFDGTSVQWECKADMDTLYRFGDIQVDCEGYDYPGDPYILTGSCRLEYTLQYTRQGMQDQEDKKYQLLYFLLLYIMISGVVFIYCCSMAPNRRSTEYLSASPGAGGRNAPGTESFASRVHTDRQYPNQGNGTTSSTASGSTGRRSQDRNEITPGTRTASGFGGTKIR